MKSRFVIAALYLIGVLFFAWGYATARYEVFPYTIIAFYEGDPSEDTSLWQKLQNDYDFSPERHLRDYVPAKLAEFQPVEVDGLRPRRDMPRVRIDPDAPPAYRIVAGAFDFTDALWGALLLDPAGRVMHRWRLNGEIDGLTRSSDLLKNLYGQAYFADGSVIFTMQEEGGGIIKMDACSKVKWTKQGDYHHTIAPVDDGSAFWTYGGKQRQLHPVLLLISSETGETLKQVDMADVEAANPDVYIFDLQWSINYKHATHPNDIQPLPAKIADRFPMFSAGDLALSYRTTNLVFVVDPNTLKIKWWRVGAGDRQHDADWHNDGTLSLFSNNFGQERSGREHYSNIVKIDPGTNAYHTVVDGKRYNFYSRINGHHEFTGHGTVLITSSSQGRVFEVDLATGETVFEFVNAFDWANGRTLHMGESLTVSRQMAETIAASNCSARELQSAL